jgi:hypothetical protein
LELESNEGDSLLPNESSDNLKRLTQKHHLASLKSFLKMAKKKKMMMMMMMRLTNK